MSALVFSFSRAACKYIKPQDSCDISDLWLCTHFLVHHYYLLFEKNLICLVEWFVNFRMSETEPTFQYPCPGVNHCIFLLVVCNILPQWTNLFDWWKVRGRWPEQGQVSHSNLHYLVKQITVEESQLAYKPKIPHTGDTNSLDRCG